MNHLIAEIKKRGKDTKVFKVFSDEEIFELPADLTNPKEYSSDYKLEDDEWFHVPEFSESKYCIELLKKDFISTEYNQINKDQLKKIKFLCSYQQHDGKEYFFFQRILPSQIVENKWFKFSNTPSLEKESNVIVINKFPDAIYSKADDCLYFKKLASIAPIFKGISELYKEATQQETEEFLQNSFVCIEGEYNAEKVGKANRKRIALAMETLNTFTEDEHKVICNYITDYCLNLAYDTEKSHFIISDEEDLKNLLWGIEQRYYTTTVGDEKRVANSVTKLL